MFFFGLLRTLSAYEERGRSLRFDKRAALQRNSSPVSEPPAGRDSLWRRRARCETRPAHPSGLREVAGHKEKMERAKGLEPSTPTLARSCSTTELHPHPRSQRLLASDEQSYAKCRPRMQQPVIPPPNAGERPISRGFRLDRRKYRKSPLTSVAAPPFTVQMAS